MSNTKQYSFNFCDIIYTSHPQKNNISNTPPSINSTVNAHNNAETIPLHRDASCYFSSSRNPSCKTKRPAFCTRPYGQ